MRHSAAIPSRPCLGNLLQPSQNDSDAVFSILAHTVSIETGWTRTLAAVAGSTTCSLPGFPMSERIPRWLCSGRLLQQQAVVFEDKLSCEATRFCAETASIRCHRQSTIKRRRNATASQAVRSSYHSSHAAISCCGSVVLPGTDPGICLGGEK